MYVACSCAYFVQSDGRFLFICLFFRANFPCDSVTVRVDPDGSPVVAHRLVMCVDLCVWSTSSCSCSSSSYCLSYRHPVSGGRPNAREPAFNCPSAGAGARHGDRKDGGDAPDRVAGRVGEHMTGSLWTLHVTLSSAALRSTSAVSALSAVLILCSLWLGVTFDGVVSKRNDTIACHAGSSRRTLSEAVLSS